MSTPRDESLSVSEAAELLGIHVDTLRDWTNEGIVPCWRTPGGHRRYRRSTIEAMRDDGSAA